MSKADIGPKIGIEGEAQFKRQLKSINTDLKTLGTEMARVTSEFIGNEHSVEALTAANDVLGATAVSLAQKNDLLRDQMQKAADAFGVADERTQKLTQEYNKNETQLNKTNAQIAANEKEIEQLTKAENTNAEATDGQTKALAELTKGTGGASGVLKVMGVDLQGLTRSLGLSSEQSQTLSEAFNGGGMSIAVAGAAAAAGIALVAAAVKEVAEFMVDAVSSATDYADNINTMATNFHISAEKLQEYQYMAELTDTSLDTITGSISKLTKSMDKARDGNSEAAEAFAKLNIRVTDANGNLRDSSDVFNEAVGALNMIHNETERDTIAMTLFGRSAMDLNSLVQSMADGSFRRFQEEARAMGYVLSDQDIQSLGELDDQFVRFDNQLTAVKNQIAAEMAPALIELAQQLLEVAQTVDWREFGRSASDAIREFTPLIIEMAQAVAVAAQNLTELLQLMGKQAKLPTQTDIGYSIGNSIRNGVTSLFGGEANAQGSGGRGSNTTFTLQLDGYTVGRATTPYVNRQNYQTGNIL